MTKSRRRSSKRKTMTRNWKSNIIIRCRRTNKEVWEKEVKEEDKDKGG